MQRQLQEAIADRDAAREEAEELHTKNQELWDENGQLEQNLMAQLETERSQSAQLQQQIEELQSQVAAVPETSLTPAGEPPDLEFVRDRFLQTTKPTERKAAKTLLDKFIREVKTESLS